AVSQFAVDNFVHTSQFLVHSSPLSVSAHRQFEHEAGASRLASLGVDAAARGFHDGSGNGQTESTVARRPAALGRCRLTCREAGLEHPFEMVRRNAAAAVFAEEN